LQIDATVSGNQTFTNTLTNMAVGDQIDLRGLTFDAAQPFPVVPTSTALTVQGTNGTETFGLQNPATQSFTASNDGSGGTLVTMTAATTVGNIADLNAAIANAGSITTPGVYQITFASISLGTTALAAINLQPGVVLEISGNLGGTGGLSISGSGAVALSGANTYTGGTTLSGATLELTAGATAGTGAITFGSQPATLQLDAPVTGTQTFPNTLTGLISGDQIDVQGVPFVAGSTAFPIPPTSNQLTVQGAGGATETFALDPVTIGFTAASDGHGGTLLTATIDPGPSVRDTTTPGEKVAHGTSVAVGTAVPGLPGDALKLTELTGPAGAVTLSDGIVSFAAPAGASGNVAFSYQVSDQYGDSAIKADILAVDPGPTAGNAHVYIPAGQNVDLTSLLLSLDPPGLPGDTLTLSAAGTAGTRGTVTLNNGDLSYTAPASGNGDAFTYTVSDQLKETATGSVSVSLLGKNGPVALTGSDAIVAGDGNYSVTGGTGSNFVSLGNGNDSVSLSGNNNTVVLGGGNDSVSLSGNNNTATLGNGNDSVTAGANSTITLGNGNDTIYAGAGDTITLGSGHDTVYAGPGDTITLGSGRDLLLFGVNPSPSIMDTEIVNGFNPNNDIIEFNRALFANFTAVLADAKPVGSDTIITHDPNNTVTLHMVALSLLTPSNIKTV